MDAPSRRADPSRGAIALAALAALGATEPARAAVPEVTLTLASPTEVLAEGERGMLRVTRDRGEGDLPVALALGGSATPEADYVLHGLDWLDGGRAILILPAGETAIDLTLEVVDDTSAEGEETVTLALEEGRGYRVEPSRNAVRLRIPRNDLVVTSAADRGEGSLRQAILNANAIEGPDIITFDPLSGPFATPQTIGLESELPSLTGELVIDGRIPDRLWQPHGVTVSGRGERRVFEIARDARVTLGALTIADGVAGEGGGILNRGDLVIRDCTLVDNMARRRGGGVSNRGTLVVVNSTLAGNRAGDKGGGLANPSATATVTSSTFAENAAKLGGGLYSSGRLLLRNTILADSPRGRDCVSRGELDPGNTHNLIEGHHRCGRPVSVADPKLQALGRYNGPTATMPLGAGSPAINGGDNASALDERGEPLRWDQRGDGDPRVVGGLTDIGAFETQAFPVLTVDTLGDADLRACTSGRADCTLRGAIRLANATAEPDTITFDPRVFAVPQTLVLLRPLPEITSDLTLDASGTAGIAIRPAGRFPAFAVSTDVSLERTGVAEETLSTGDRPR